MQIGDFKTEQEANNCLLYTKTDFVTFLFGAIAITQDATKKFYVLIPDIDFKTGEVKDRQSIFLDFNKPETLDEQLVEFYGLTVDESELMKSSIRPWRDKFSLTADGIY